MPPPLTAAGAHVPQPQLSSTFRFSMRRLLGVVTFVAIAAAILSFLAKGGFGFLVAQLLGVTLLLTAPLCLGTLAIYCRGGRQTFFLGALVGSLTPLLLSWRGSFGNWLQLTIFLAFNLASAMACGWLALATRRFAERRGWHLPPRDDHSNPAN